MAYVGNPGSNKIITTDASGKLAPGIVGDGLSLSGGKVRPNQTIIDVDYTLLSDSTQALSNGTVTIGGLDYTIQNSANAASFQFVNGSGFVVAPQNVTGVSAQWNYAGSGVQRTAPAVLLPFSSINSSTGVSVGLGSRIRVWVYVSNQSFGTSPEDTNVLVCVDNSFAGSTMNSVMVVRGAQGSNNQCRISTDYVYGGSQITNSAWQTGNISPSSLCDVIMIEVDSIQPKNFAGFYGSYSNGWPNFSLMTTQFQGARSQPDNSTGSTSLFNNVMQTVAIAFAGGTGADPATISRLRVDIW